MRGCELPGRNTYLSQYTIARYQKLTMDEAVDETAVYYNCLITRQYDPLGRTFAYRMEVYLSTVSGAHMQQHSYPVGCPTQWRADGWLTQKPEGHLLWYRVSDVGTQKVWHQRRELLARARLDRF